jgi:putative glutamine amidotransferase
MTVPIVGVMSCTVSVEGFPYNGVMTKYLNAISDHANCTPLIIPANSGVTPDILNRLDGLLLTGSLSNVHPRYYEKAEGPVDFAIDEDRDEAILPIIRAAFSQGVPVFAICRGLQELNVALGGSLQTDVGGDRSDNRHHPVDGTNIEAMFAPSHSIEFSKRGFFSELTGQSQAVVNSVHHQAILEPSSNLTIEAVAPDGVVEAVSGTGSGFTLGVQWHPEWNANTDSISQQLFESFGNACRAHAKLITHAKI